MVHLGNFRKGNLTVQRMHTISKLTNCMVIIFNFSIDLRDFQFIFLGSVGKEKKNKLINFLGADVIAWKLLPLNRIFIYFNKAKATMYIRSDGLPLPLLT